MLKSLYSAVSGLSVNQSSMDVIGNNIANVNTIGFKQSRAVFQDLLSQTLVGGKTPTDSRGGINPRQVGSGAYLAAVDNIFANGVIKSTQKITDLAVQGEGMFVMRGEGNNELFYTRAGDFNFDRSQTLTNPSGYKVQGWMSDPDTGVMQLDGGVSDIVLGTAYQVMKPKASTAVNFSGTLDTIAKPSILKYPQFLTQATSQQNLSSLKSEDGTALDLGTTEKVSIRAHATNKSFMSELYSKGSASPLALTDGTTVQFMIGTTPHSVTYKAIDTGTLNDGDFNSVESFIQEVNNLFSTLGPGGTPIATMSIAEGKFKISGLASLEMASITCANSTLTSILSPLVGTYGAGFTKDSQEAFFQKEVTAGENFNNLSELGVQIENALNGSVVTNGFNVEFLENNFGLREGEGITFGGLSVTDAGGVATALNLPTFRYTDSSTPDAALSQFHTIQELAGLLTRGINAAAAAAGVPTSITFGVVNNKIQLTHQNGATVLFGAVTAEPAAGAGNVEPNPYLENLLSKLNGQALGVSNRGIVTDEIAGKGRLAYNYASTKENSFDVTKGFMGMTVGEEFTLNLTTSTGGGAATARALTYTYNPNPAVDGVGTSFSTLTGLAQAINNTMAASGIDMTADVVNGQLRFTDALTGTDTITFNPSTTNAANPIFSQQFSATVTGTLTSAAGEAVNSAFTSRIDIPAITGLSIMKGSKGDIFNNNMLMSNNIGADNSITSRRFLSVADSSSKIVDLFASNGDTFGFNEQESINMSGSIGGEKVTNNDAFNIGSTTTVLDLMTAMEDYLGLGSSHNSMKNVTLVDGMLQVVGEKGQGNTIDFLKLSSPLSKNAAFNNAMTNVTIAQAASGGFSPTTIDIFDEQGNKHAVNFKFSLWNEEKNEWRLTIVPNDDTNQVSINGATSNELIMKFNSDGTLAYLYDRFPDPQKIIVNPTIRFSAANGTNTLDNIALNLGTQGSNDGMSLAAGKGGFRQNSSDGYTMGELKEKMFNPAGELVGTYSNGQIRTLAQIALGTFSNQQGLLKVGDTMFAATGSSGQATLGQAQAGGRGDIAASSLENSNVDISQELVSMITTQRGFQANSKVITTSDEMIQEVLNMKR